MKVKDVMHKGVDWVSPDTPVTELAKLMREHDIGAIPIGENDRLINHEVDKTNAIQVVAGVAVCGGVQIEF
jgi:CBS domain-containing protein